MTYNVAFDALSVGAFLHIVPELGKEEVAISQLISKKGGGFASLPRPPPPLDFLIPFGLGA